MAGAIKTTRPAAARAPSGVDAVHVFEVEPVEFGSDELCSACWCDGDRGVARYFSDDGAGGFSGNDDDVNYAGFRFVAIHHRLDEHECGVNAFTDACAGIRRRT